MQWFQALLPREQSFFEKFTAHARVLVKGSEALRELLEGGDGVEAACAEIVRQEEAADEIARDLTNSLDDAIDQMQKTAKSITLFQVREFSPEMRELGDLAIQAAYLTLEG